MIRKIHELSPKEVLALAIQVEQTNGDRLRHFAKAFEAYDGEAALKFRELAEEEDLHGEWLTQKFRRRFKGPIPIVTEFDVEGMVEIIELGLPDKVSDLLKAVEIYVLALRAENRAGQFYRDAESAAMDRSLRLLFHQLASMENDHAGWLEKKVQEMDEREAKRGVSL